MFIWRKVIYLLFAFSLILYLGLFLCEKWLPRFVTHDEVFTVLICIVLGLGLANALLPLSSLEEPTLKIRRWVRPRMRAIYVWMVLIASLILIINRPEIYTKVVDKQRQAGEQYTIRLVNQTGEAKYSQTYKQLLVNYGYKNVVIGQESEYANLTTTTILYGGSDELAGVEISKILKQSLPSLQTAPLMGKPGEIVVVLGRSEP